MMFRALIEHAKKKHADDIWRNGSYKTKQKIK